MLIEEALEKAKSGDKEAIGLLYDISYERVYRMIYHRTLDIAFTEDIISEVYMKVIKNIKKFLGKTEGEYYSWILRIAYTTLIDTLRDQKPIDSFDTVEWELSESINIGENIDHRQKLYEVIAYMNTLPERDRIILTLRIWDDLSYNEIAEITGESVSNSKKIVSRGLQKILANVSPWTLILLFFFHVTIR